MIKTIILMFALICLGSAVSAENICSGDSCYYRGNLGISFDTAVCGNSLVETGEECDLSSIPTTSCSDRLGGKWSGEIKCSSSCKIDTSECSKNQGSRGGSQNSGSGGFAADDTEKIISLHIGKNKIEPRTIYISEADSEVFSLKLAEIGKDYIIINISSKYSFEERLNINEKRTLCIDGDGDPEVLLTLDSIDNNNSVIDFDFYNSLDTESPNNEKSLNFAWLLVFVVLAITGAAVILAITGRKKSSSAVTGN
jgi:hypothetical protein